MRCAASMWSGCNDALREREREEEEDAEAANAACCASVALPLLLLRPSRLCERRGVDLDVGVLPLCACSEGCLPTSGAVAAAVAVRGVEETCDAAPREARL